MVVWDCFHQSWPELKPDAWKGPAYDAVTAQEYFFLFVPRKDSEIGPSTLFTRMVLCKVWLSPELNTTLKGHRLLDAVKIQGHVATIVEGVAGQGFQQCFEHWKYWLMQCACTQADYFKVRGTVNVWVITYSYYGGHSGNLWHLYNLCSALKILGLSTEGG